jgi:hypothetical protein
VCDLLGAYSNVLIGHSCVEFHRVRSKQRKYVRPAACTCSNVLEAYCSP